MAVVEQTSVTGRRVPDGTPFLELQAGDYCKRLVPGASPWERWWVCCPDGGLTPLAHGRHRDQSGRFHEVEEHDDGTISVLPRPANSNSILSPKGWHGYLDRGVWREAGGA